MRHPAPGPPPRDRRPRPLRAHRPGRGSHPTEGNAPARGVLLVLCALLALAAPVWSARADAWRPHDAHGIGVTRVADSTVTSWPPTSGDVFYTVSGDTVWIRGSVSASVDVAQQYFLKSATAGNGNWEWGSSFVLSPGAANTLAGYRAGRMITNFADDAPPVYSSNCGFIMGNHGLLVPTATYAGHNKSKADIGALYTDGTYFYELAEISGNTLTFYPKPAGGSLWSMHATIDQPLRYVSGGRDTTHIQTSSVGQAQKFPVVKNHTSVVLVDGRYPVQKRMSGRASYVDIVEEFDLVDPSTIDTTRAPWDWSAGAAWIHVKLTHRARAGQTVTRSQYAILRPFRFGYMGFLQVAPMVAAAYDSQFVYLPHTLTRTVNGKAYAFQNVQEFSAPPDSAIVYLDGFVDTRGRSTLSAPLCPPDRAAVLFKDTNGSGYDLGFAFGYAPFDSATTRDTDGKWGWWRFGASGKAYPILDAGTGVDSTGTYDVYTYRIWFDPGAYPNGKWQYGYQAGVHDVLVVDYPDSVTDDVTTLAGEYADKYPRLADSKNITTTATQVAVASSLTTSTMADPGFAVWELAIYPALAETLYADSIVARTRLDGVGSVLWRATQVASQSADGTDMTCDSLWAWDDGSGYATGSATVEYRVHPPSAFATAIDSVQMWVRAAKVDSVDTAGVVKLQWLIDGIPAGGEASLASASGWYELGLSEDPITGNPWTMEGLYSRTFGWSVEPTTGSTGGQAEGAIVEEYKVIVWGHGRQQGVAVEPDAPIARTALAPARPNPSRTTTALRFLLPRAGRVRLAILDVAGRRVRTLLDGALSAGSHEAAWDGRGENGGRAPAGLYWARLEADGAVCTQRLVRLR